MSVCQLFPGTRTHAPRGLFPQVGGGAGRRDRRAPPGPGYDPAVPDLVLLRHGQSTWNAAEPLHRLAGRGADRGGRRGGPPERPAAGRPGRPGPANPAHLGADPGHRTANLALAEAGRSWLPVRRHWRLNERHYGALQGLNKKDTADKSGPSRSTSGGGATTPRRRPVEPGSEHHPAGDPRYRDVPGDVLPRTECLADVVARMLPYWDDVIVPDLAAEAARGGAVLVVAHGNSLRALRKHLKAIPDDEIVEPRDPDRRPLPLPPGRRPVGDRRRLPGRPEAAAAAGRGGPAPGRLDPGRAVDPGAPGPGPLAEPPALNDSRWRGQLRGRPSPAHRSGPGRSSSTGRTHTLPSPILPVAAVVDDGVDHLVDLGVVDDDLETDLRARSRPRTRHPGRPRCGPAGGRSPGLRSGSGRAPRGSSGPP